MELSASLDNAIAYMKSQFQQGLQRILKENQEQWESKLKQSQQSLLKEIDPNCVKLNVGGKKFITTMEILTNMKNTKIERMLTERYPIMLDHKKRIFIDRDGHYFGYVLDCLRNKQVILPESGQLKKRIEGELKYFEIVDDPDTRKKIGTLSTAGEVNVQGNYAWKFSTQGTIQPLADKIQAEAQAYIPGHIIGDKDIKSGAHEWKFNIEINSNDADGLVVFGIIEQGIWENIKTGLEDYISCYGFSTQGDTFLGPEGDDDTEFHEQIAFGSEIKMIYRTSEMKLQVEYNKNGMKKSYNIIGVSEGTYYPYFYFVNARVKLLETA